jgi:signal transduction histidine kinase
MAHEVPRGAAPAASTSERIKEHLRRITQLSLGSAPEALLDASLQACIDISGASGGSILGEEGPSLHFLFSNVPELIGVRVPFGSIAGVTVTEGRIVYTHAPTDRRHFAGVDEKLHRQTQYLLSIPIPSVQRSRDAARAARNAGALQLLFSRDVLPASDVAKGRCEFSLESFGSQDLSLANLGDVLALLPIISFGMEVMKLRQTSYQVIHELKNKLISGHAWVNTLREDLEQACPTVLGQDAIREDFDLAGGAMREGAELAKAYLQFTKLYDPVFAPTDLGALLAEVAASARAFASGAGGDIVEIVLEAPGPLPPLSADASHLKMAFFNLSKNAVEALQGGGVASPRLTLSAVAGGGAHVQVTIRDNGPGMPEEIARNLFIPFKTRKSGGTGLGLTITKKIVDSHGGSIRCETGPGGTAFVVDL